MTLKQRVNQHDKEIAEIRALQAEFRKDMKVLDKAMIRLVNEQAELTRTINSFIKSLGVKNGHRKKS